MGRLGLCVEVYPTLKASGRFQDHSLRGTETSDMGWQRKSESNDAELAYGFACLFVFAD